MAAPTDAETGDPIASTLWWQSGEILPGHEHHWLIHYAIPFSFGLCLILLLWNLVLLCRIQFRRDKPVTKLTFTPYILSFCFLTSQLLESALVEYNNENPPKHPPAPRPLGADDEIGLLPIFNSKSHRQWTQALFCTKFVLFFAFVLVQTFEIEVLCLFMLSQKSVRLEQLDLVRPRYNRIEQKLWKFTKVYVVVIIFVPSTDFYYVVMVQSGFMMFVLIFTFQEYLWASMTRVCLMYKFHRYEYKRHACGLIGLQCTMLFSLAYAVMGFYSTTLASTCIQSEMEYNIEVHRSNDLCFSIFTVSKVSPAQASLTYFIFIIAEMLPFVFYFSLNEPHDCFRCLGKDPDRRYSVFQLTHRENLIREHQIQYGTGAFGVHGNLTPASHEPHDMLHSTDSGGRSGSLQVRPTSQELYLVRMSSKLIRKKDVLSMERQTSVPVPNPCMFPSELSNSAEDSRHGSSQLSHSRLDSSTNRGTMMRQNGVSIHLTTTRKTSTGQRQIVPLLEETNECSVTQFANLMNRTGHIRESEADAFVNATQLDETRIQQRRSDELTTEDVDILVDPRRTRRICQLTTSNHEEYLLMSNMEDADLIYQYGGTILTTDSVVDSNNTSNLTSHFTAI